MCCCSRIWTGQRPPDPTVSALEHAVPVATTFGRLSEPFWRDTAAVETVAADAATVWRPRSCGCSSRRATRGTVGGGCVYAARFDPRVVLDPLFAD